MRFHREVTLRITNKNDQNIHEVVVLIPIICIKKIQVVCRGVCPNPEELLNNCKNHGTSENRIETQSDAGEKEKKSC